MLSFPKKPTDKYSNKEKELCPDQIKEIEHHISTCSICKSSFNSQKHGIPIKPACQSFLKQLKKHIDNCDICNQANRKWNIDSIPITDEVREVLNLIPDKGIALDPIRLKEYLKALKGIDIQKIERVQNYLLKEIEKKNV